MVWRFLIAKRKSSVRKINPNISKKLDDIIMKCLAKNKRERNQGISELIKDLEEVI